MSKVARLLLERSHGVFVGPNSRVHPSVRFPHPTGIIIGDGATIGEGAVVFQHVTLGGRRLNDGSVAGYPNVGKNVTIYSGACLLGPISVADGSVVGAGTVVLMNVPAGATVVGVPGRILEKSK